MNILPIVIFGGAAVALLFFLGRTMSRGKSIGLVPRLPQTQAEYNDRFSAHEKAAKQLALFVLTLIVAVPVFVEPLLRKSAMETVTLLPAIHLGFVGVFSMLIFVMYFFVTGNRNLPLHRLLAKLVVAAAVLMTVTGFMLLARIIY